MLEVRRVAEALQIFAVLQFSGEPMYSTTVLLLPAVDYRIRCSNCLQAHVGCTIAIMVTATIILQASQRGC
jgi:hypothetical protein